MTDRVISASEYIDLGVIKIVRSSSEFPWGIFTSGKINCAYSFNEADCPINDMRLWLNTNAVDRVYLQYTKWTLCRIAFTNLDDAIQFSIKFGDVLQKL